MYEFLYDYVKAKYGKIFGTSNCEINRPLPKERNKKVIGLMKYELGGKIMK